MIEGGIYFEEEISEEISTITIIITQIGYDVVGIDVTVKGDSITRENINDNLMKMINSNHEDIFWIEDDKDWLEGELNGYLGKINEDIFDELVRKAKKWYKLFD